jgi:hypothetical protein
MLSILSIRCAAFALQQLATSSSPPNHHLLPPEDYSSNEDNNSSSQANNMGISEVEHVQLSDAPVKCPKTNTKPFELWFKQRYKFGFDKSQARECVEFVLYASNLIKSK